MSKPLEVGLVMNLVNMYSKIQRQMGSSLSAHGLGLSEYLVLNQLYTAPNQKMRRRDLAEGVGMSPSGITRLLNPMEKIGLIAKEENPRDARVSLVALSEAGRQTIEEAKVSFEFTANTLFEPLTEAQLNEFSALLETVTR